MGAVRFPSDFVLTQNLIKELDLDAIDFNLGLNSTFTRDKWYPKKKINRSQERYFLPSNTPAKQTALTLLNDTLLELFGTLNSEELDPNKIINDVKLIDWPISSLLRLRLTHEQVEWISNSIDFSLYKLNIGAYAFGLSFFHSDKLTTVGPVFGNNIKIIEKLESRTKSKKLLNNQLESANFCTHCRKWKLQILNVKTGNKTRKTCAKLLFCGTVQDLKYVNLTISRNKIEKLDELINCTIPFQLNRIYIRYPFKWWKLNSGSQYSDIIGMTWIMSKDSPILIASYCDGYQCDFLQNYPESKILEILHENIIKSFGVKDVESIPYPIDYVQKVWTNPTYSVYFYKPGINPKDIQNQSAKPFIDIPLYIASETLSEKQAWVEGALSASNCTTNKILSLNLKEEI